MSRELTNAQFASQTAFMAKNCAAWCGDLLTTCDANEPVQGYMLLRFLDDMRGRLDRLEEWSLESQTTPSQE